MNYFEAINCEQPDYEILNRPYRQNDELRVELKLDKGMVVEAKGDIVWGVLGCLAVLAGGLLYLMGNSSSGENNLIERWEYNDDWLDF